MSEFLQKIVDKLRETESVALIDLKRINNLPANWHENANLQFDNNLPELVQECITPFTPRIR